METASDDPKFLQDVWTLYFHDPENTDWTLGSYLRVCDISTIEDYWVMAASIAAFLSRGMFFVMREHVFPCWDDKSNITGGCLSLKVPKQDLPRCWEHIMKHVLGESLLARPSEGSDEEEMWSVVNGVSVSPKRYFCIIKLWLRCDAFTCRADFNLPPFYTGEVLYRANTDNIRNNNSAMLAAPKGRRAS